jgi:hypothetical protein
MDTSDTSITTHAGLRVVEYGRGRFVVEVKVDESSRTITIRCAPGIARLANALAWKVGEELGWRMHGGGSSAFTGPVGGYETGNGRHWESANAYPAPKVAPARRRAPKVHAIVANRVDVKLYDHETTSDIFWSERCNSYVLAAAQPHDREALKLGTANVLLVSVNGAGEIRWTVTKWQLDMSVEQEAAGRKVGGDAEEQLAAAKHFGIVAARAGEAVPCFGR